MADKLNSILQWAQTKLRSFSISKESMKYIVWYAIILVFGVTVYFIGWFYLWWLTGKPDIVELRNFLHELASAQWVALMGFLAKAFIDQNHDGIPDEFENMKGDSKDETRN